MVDPTEKACQLQRDWSLAIGQLSDKLSNQMESLLLFFLSVIGSHVLDWLEKIFHYIQSFICWLLPKEEQFRIISFWSPCPFLFIFGTEIKRTKFKNHFDQEKIDTFEIFVFCRYNGAPL